MNGVSIHLVVEDVAEALDWYPKALGATVRRVLHLPDGSPALADLDILGTLVAVAAPIPGGTMATPATSGTTAAAYHLTVEDAAAALGRAEEAGATVFEPLHDAFWGDRTGQVLDPWGHRWAFDQHVRGVSDSEVERELASLSSGQTDDR
jgi:PhnB protein